MSTVNRVIRSRQRRRRDTRTGMQLVRRWMVVAGLVTAGILVLGLMTGFGSAVGVYAFYVKDLPMPEEIQRVEQDFQTTKIYDRTGTVLLHEIIDPLGGDRRWVELEEVPLDLRNATVAIEDRTFYQNPGYSLEGLARAMFFNLIGGQVQGGSSITQQLVKNVLIDPRERTQASYGRKIKELILATEISRRYTKDQILEWYLNTNFYGNLAYGVEAAAQVYFGKPVRELTLAECAMLAAIPQSPAMNPIDNPELAKQRQAVVLDAMVAEGYITAEQAEVAKSVELETRLAEQRFSLEAPHFSLYVRQQLEDMFGPDLIYRGGLTVYTTLDADLQRQAECVARSHIARLSGAAPDTVVPASDGGECAAAHFLPLLSDELRGVDHQASNAAVVVINADTGEILAMVGSLDYYNEEIDGKYNVALAERQPGSAFKPLTYVTAFAQGYTPASMTLDVRTAFDNQSVQPYVPENFDRRFHGPQSIRSALANSYNVPAVQVLSWVGVDSVIRTAHGMGINTLNDELGRYGLSLTLGGGEVTLLDMTYAYSVFANMGQMNGQPTPVEDRRPGYRTLDPASILRVEDRNGNVLWEYGTHDTLATNDILSPSLAYLINDILSDVEARRPSMGSDDPLTLSRPAAAKTGTTNDFRDAWTVGYTPQIVAGVWVGNSDNSPMVELAGRDGAAPIWHAVMEYALRDLPIEEWQRPPDVVEAEVCETSGLLPTEYCPTHTEIFIDGTQPTALDDIYQPFQINRDTGLLATVHTPPELVEERVYQILPPEAADWVRETGLPQPPTEYDTLSAPNAIGNVVITSPAPYSYVAGRVEIRGNATGAGFSFYRLDYGQGLSPTEWVQIDENQTRPVVDNLLQVWDAAPLEGLYSLRLTMVRGDQSFQEFVIQVTVDNERPQVRLLYPEDQQVYHPSDEFVTIQPLVEDNVSMDRVEFYVDDKLIATSTVPPFNERWFIAGIGRHVIYVRAYDAAGNSTVSQRVTITVERD